MKKVLGIAAASVLVVGMLAGCGSKDDNKDAASQAPAATQAATKAPAASTAPDAVTTASIVNTEEAFLKAISKDGTWIIATLGDMKIDKELVLEGTFTNKDKPARKIALYTQDADHKITASFKLTAPKLTVKSENSRIQGGTFVGDVYVDVPNFYIQDGGIDGNLYFTKQEYKDTYTSKNATVTGVTEVKAP